MAEDNRRVAQGVGGKIQAHLEPFVDFLGDFNKESDRGAVLSAAAYVNDLLGKTISAFLIRGNATKEFVSEYPGGLSTFSARIAAAYAMGLISEKERSEATMKFQTAAVALILNLTNRPAHVAKHPLKHQAWPY